MEGLEGFGGFGGFWSLGPGVPVGEVALALRCVLGRVFGGFGGCLEGLEGFGGCLEGLEGFGGFGVFAGWQTAALKANRKPLLWPLALGCLFEKWPWPWGACWGRCLEGLEGVWRVWRVLERLDGLRAGKRYL